MLNHVVDGFTEHYGRAPEVVAFAPGRLEILGNHTDYNEGVVLSCAVDLGTYFAATASPDGVSRVKDLRDGSIREFDTSSLTQLGQNDWPIMLRALLSR